MATTFENIITLTQISDGPQGPAGPPADLYKVETNVEEILQFKNPSNNIYEISPMSLTFKLFREQTQLTPEEGKVSFTFLSTQEDKSYNITDKLSLNNEQFEFNFEDLIRKQGSESTTLFNNNLEEPEISVESAFENLRFNPLLFIFSYQDGEINIEKKLVFRNGMSQDMLDFSVTASNITALTNSSKMLFDQEGLTITDANFKIQKSLEGSLITMLEATEDGYLNLNRIKANTGTIGGFTIEDDHLKSEDGSLSLYGTNGLIRANAIELGTGATIMDSIAFEYKYDNSPVGIAYLYNPNNYNGKILSGNIYEEGVEKEALAIFANGNANFGYIQINGKDSSITGQNWTLTPSQANFDNIVVSGTIKTAVFEQGSVQSVGSTMLFMRSYKIKEFNGNNPILEQKADLNQGMLVWLVQNNAYQTCTVQAISEDGLTIELATNNIGEEVNTEATALIVIGSEDNNSLIFGINNSDVEIANDLILPNGLTINEYGNDGLPHLFLGDLTRVGKIGYGLYSDNVYLRGSLTTQVGEGEKATYAGLNTNAGSKANIFSNFIDNSKIVFWAGSKSEKDEDIQKAYFQVTEAGSIYAGRAELTDSIFIEGTIKGADIYTARIHGNGEGENIPALTIYDTSGGISFKTGYNNDNSSSGIETCRINKEGFYTENNDVSITFKKDTYMTKLVNSGLFAQQKIEESHFNSGLKLGIETLSLQIKNNDKLIVSDQQTNVKNQLEIDNTLILGGSDRVKYQSVTGGYDLYIISEEEK